VVGDPEQVRGVRHATVLEGGQGPDGPEEDLLGEILGFGRVIGEPGHGAEDRLPAPATQLADGCLIPRGSRGDESPFVHPTQLRLPRSVSFTSDNEPRSMV
jgi:hypothetical protein